MFDIQLHISYNQLLFLKYVAGGCQGDDPMADYSHWLPLPRALQNKGWIKHQKEKPNWALTQKGDALMKWLTLELKDGLA